MVDLKGLATGIGSLSHRDVDLALNLIFKYLPDIPFWPQLPNRDVREGMLAQFSENLPCLKVGGDGLCFNPQEKEKELETFYARLIANDLNYFKISEDFALGLYRFHRRLEEEGLGGIKFIKCQVTGPFTLAASIKDENGIALLHDPIFMQAVIKGLTMKALWQIRFFEKFGRKIIIFLDEPYLGSFGSAYTPINREDLIRGLSELIAILKSKDIFLGIHCCGNTDWSMFTEIDLIDIISFDAFSFQDKFVLYADNLKGFLKRNGIVCWGIVPTQEFTGDQTAELLANRVRGAIEALVRKGVDEDLLLSNLLISPSCGLGNLTIQKAERIFELLSETSFLIREK